jgi:putative hydrolase of the HAD superfamily
MDYRQFALAWSDMFDEDQETQRLVARAPVRRRVLLSNTNEIHWEFLQERYAHVLAPFDDLVVSHEVGLEKPDPAIYHWVASRTGHSPEAHLFIDDIEENVIAAREAGWDGIHHTDAGRLYRELRRRGLAPE